MTKKYLIALDLDGTVLNNDNKISSETKQVIQHLIKDGHIVIIATGRANRMSHMYYHELRLNTPMINANGAFIHHPTDKNWEVHHQPLQLSTAMEIIDISFSLSADNVIAMVQDAVYMENHNQHVVDFYGQAGTMDNFFIGELKQNLKHAPTGMLLYPHIDFLDQLTNQLSDLETAAVDHRNWGDPFQVIEVVDHRMNKREGLKKVAAEFNIPQERIIAIGDGTNDLEMVEYAGIGVAMDNAVEDLKTVAKYSTVTNEDHGVAKFLIEYFNIKSLIVS